MIPTTIPNQSTTEPWKLNRRWATGVITDDSRSNLIGAWMGAIIWNGFTLPITLTLLRHPHKAPLAMLALFSVVGLGLLFAALFQTIRARKFGQSQLTLTPFPAHPGQPLNATIRVHTSLLDAQDVVAHLQCIRREQHSTGKNTSTIEHILWDDQQHAPILADQSDTLLRVSFNPPPDALETNNADFRNKILWRLTVRAARAGLDYRSTFELPLFARPPGDTSPATSPAPRSAPIPPPATLPTTELAAQRIYIRLLAGKAFAVDFPPARHIGNAITLTIMAAIFDAVAIGMARVRGMPYFFEAVKMHIALSVGFFGLILTLIALSLWLVRTTATVDRTAVTVTRSILGIPRRTSIPATQITAVTSEQTMTSNGTVFYSIDIKTQDGKTLQFGSGIADNHVADRLAAAIFDVLHAQ